MSKSFQILVIFSSQFQYLYSSFVCVFDINRFRIPISSLIVKWNERGSQLIRSSVQADLDDQGRTKK